MDDRLDEVTSVLAEMFGVLKESTIDSIVYHDFAYEEEYVTWNAHGDTFDTVEFGVDVVLKSGCTIGVIWEWDRYQYGLVPRKGSLSEVLGPHAALDVSHQSRWSSLLDRRICDAVAYWSPPDPDYGYCIYPVSIEIEFERDQYIVLAAAEYMKGSDAVALDMDNVLIVSERQVAATFHLGRYR